MLLPLWTSLLVRTAAWFVLLQNEGLINGALQAIGLIDAPLAADLQPDRRLIAMTHVLLPFMVLPIYSVLVAIPQNLMPAAASMGAAPAAGLLARAAAAQPAGPLSGSLLVFMVAHRLLHHAGPGRRSRTTR